MKSYHNRLDTTKTSNILTKTNLGLAGINIALLIIAYIAYQDQPISIKVALSLLITSIIAVIGRTLHTMREIQKDVRRGYIEKFTSEENEIARFRKKYHFYWITQENGGKLSWRYTYYDFRKFRLPGRLLAISNEKAPFGKKIEYRMEGIVRGRRLVIVKYNLGGDEVPTIGVFHSFSGFSPPYYFGTYAEEPYDVRQPDIIAPVIMSEELIKSWKTVGKVDKPEVCAKLSTLWNENAKSIIRIPPSEDQASWREKHN